MAVLACLLRGLPVVATMREPVPNFKDYPPAPVVSAVNRLLAYVSDVTIVNGSNHVAILQNRYKVPASRISYIPLGPRTTAAKWSTRAVSEEPGTILFFGRIARNKGLEYLVRAQPMITRRVPHARIVVAGRGKDELDRCRPMIQDGSRFEIHDGFIPNDQVAELLQRACQRKVTLNHLPWYSNQKVGYSA